MSDSLPDYAQRLDALHAALQVEFSSIVASLALRGDAQVLDAGCGDGFFAQLLAQGLTSGQVHAIDSSAAFLEAARARLGGLVDEGRVRLVEGNVNSLPFEAGSLDVVWSAHSMQSYDELSEVLREFRRVLKPRGTLAVLESDALHSIMLPWPARVELAVRQAELRSLGDQDERQGAYFPRYAARLFREAGFGAVKVRHTLIYRSAPLQAPLRKYLSLYLEDLLERTGDLLDGESKRVVERLAGDSAGTSPAAVDLESFSSLQVLLTARASD